MKKSTLLQKLQRICEDANERYELVSWRQKNEKTKKWRTIAEGEAFGIASVLEELEDLIAEASAEEA